MTDKIRAFSIDKYIASNDLQGWDQSMGYNNDWYKLTQLVSRSKFVDFISETVLEGMVMIMEEELIGRQIFQDMSTNSPVISWLEEHGFDAQVLSEGAAPRNARLRYHKKTFRPIMLGLGLEFTHQVLRDTDQLDVLGRHVARVAKAIAYRENQYLLAVALNGVADGSTPHLSGDIFTNHVLEATDATWAGNAGIMDAERIQVIQQIFQEENFNMTTMITSPATYTGMMTLVDFRSSNVIQHLSPGSMTNIDNGAIGRPHFLPSGMEIISNRGMPNGLALFIDKNEFGGYFEIEGLSNVELPTDLARMKRMAWFKEIGAVAMKPEAAVLMQGLTAKNPADYVTAA